jgi:transposase, IS30 family
VARLGASRSVMLVFWEAVGRGVPVEEACQVAGVSEGTGKRWFRDAGGVIGNAPQQVTGRFLSFVEREEIMVGLAEGLSIRQVAERLGRSPSTISREIDRNPDSRGKYRAVLAEQNARARARRPKVAKLAGNPELRAWVAERLRRRWSPEQISAKLTEAFPDRPEMWVSHETIYQSIYVQGRGALRRELAVCLRTGRALRRPKRRVDARTERIPDKVMISQRPAEVDDRAVPGHWEGDLIIGAYSASAIGTLVERATRFVILLHLPERHDAATVRDRIIEAIDALPEHLHRSLTWDQGSELAYHQQITVATGVPVYFCDPHAPWQRGTNENTNGLLRQYFPKGTDLSQYTKENLDAVAAELNARPRKTLAWRTPAEALDALLSTT